MDVLAQITQEKPKEPTMMEKLSGAISGAVDTVKAGAGNLLEKGKNTFGIKPKDIGEVNSNNVLQKTLGIGGEFKDVRDAQRQQILGAE